MLVEIFDWGGLQQAWDWAGIATHFFVGEAAALIMAGILIYGRHHARHSGRLHRFAHSYKAQFGVDAMIDIVIAILTIQVMHL